MKKIITILLAVMMACFSLTAFAAETTISGFDATDISTFMGWNAGLAGYGLTAPSISAVAGNDGNGVKVDCIRTAAVCDFHITDADVVAAIKNGTTGQYFRIYMDATGSDVELSFRLNFGGANVFDSSQCVLVATDGSKPTVTTGEGGMGGNSKAAVIVPAGFKGFIYWPLSAYSGDVANAEKLNIDIRFGAWSPLPNEPAGDIYYVLDSAQFVDDITTTADISVIAYAVAAITGLGALVVAKKR